MNTFCPELQLPWTLSRIRYTNLERIVLVLTAGIFEPRPSTDGRHVSDVVSYPSIYTDHVEAEFVFTKCMAFEIHSDDAICTSNDGGEGETFLRFLESEPLRIQREANFGRSLYHYRLICGGDEVIDIICRETPSITRRIFNSPTDRIAG